MRDRSISSVAGGLLAGLLTVLALASPAPAPAQPVPPGRSIAWQSVDPPGTRVTGLAVSGGTPQVVYASTRVEVLRSDDGGTGWRLLPGSPGGDAVAVHPETAEIVLVGSGSGGLRARGVFRSTDGGATWERTLSNPTGIMWAPPRGSSAAPTPATPSRSATRGCGVPFSPSSRSARRIPRSSTPAPATASFAASTQERVGFPPTVRRTPGTKVASASPARWSPSPWIPGTPKPSWPPPPPPSSAPPMAGTPGRTSSTVASGVCRIWLPIHRSHSG